MTPIQEAKKLQALYHPNETITRRLGQINLLLFVGPAGVGKSTTLDLVHQLDTRFGRTGSMGTRQPEPRDRPGLYHQYTTEELLTRIEAGELASYTIHPTTEMIYATAPEMYRYAYNMLECLPRAAEQFWQLPFKRIITYYIVTDPLAWQAWFTDRYPNAGNERNKRAREAVLSLEWALSQSSSSLRWINNIPEQQEKTARAIIKSIDQPVDNDMSLRLVAEKMLMVAKELSTDI